jgi:non-ribosomal peptide synthetase component F
MWTPVAMLAVMKAGGSSVAMDSTLPEERLRTIVRQVDPTLIVSSAANRALASRLSPGTVVVADSVHLECLKEALEIPFTNVKPSDKLYVVFTSGSTGTPKGAIITHRNFSSAIKHQRGVFGIRATSRVFDFASYAFDDTWFNVLCTLSCGACLCVASEAEKRDDITTCIYSMDVTWAVLTPSTSRLLEPEKIPSLETLVLTGEAMTRKDLRTWASGVDIRNMYGPAECTPAASGTRLHQQNSSPDNIGRGLGLVAWICDANGSDALIPYGCVGELWLEGPLVGEGYLSNPEKTAAAFVEDPPWLLRGGPGVSGRRGRLYKTGELVRYNPDGTLRTHRSRSVGSGLSSVTLSTMCSFVFPPSTRVWAL